MRPMTIAIPLLALAVPAAAPHAQTAPTGWAFGATGFGVYWTDDGAPFDTFGGPALQISRLTPRGLGFDFRGGYILPTGFYGMTGASATVGLSYGLPFGAHLFQLKTGVAAFAGNDSDGSMFGGGGPYAGAAATLRIAGRFGIQIEGSAQHYKTGDGWVFGPGAAVGLMFLPRGR
jgi:hypothetical protein